MELTEATPINRYTNLSLQQLIDARYNLKEEKAIVAARERELKKEMDIVDEMLVAYHYDNPEVAQIRGEEAKVAWSQETHYNTDAGTKEQVRDWLIEQGHQHLMTWHLNRAATDEFVKLYGDIPNVSPYVKDKVSCTKL